MKKVFLLSALALAAMTMSAQLELIGTVNFPADQLTDNNYEHCIYNTTNRPPFQYYATTDTTATTVTVHLFEYATLNEVKSVTLNRTVVKPSQYGYAAYALFIYKNFWANDNKIYFLLEDGTKEDWNLNLYCEDGNLIKNFNAPGSVYLVNTNIGYLLLEEIGDDKLPMLARL